jgi:hypothetical protein
MHTDRRPEEGKAEASPPAQGTIDEAARLARADGVQAAPPRPRAAPAGGSPWGLRAFTPGKLIGMAVVAAAAVFLITFATTYLGGTQGKDDKKTDTPTPDARLTFTENSYPVLPGPDEAKPPEELTPAVGEVSAPDGPKHEYRHDFWFKNGSGQALAVGLQSKNCQCTTAELYLAPPEYTDVPATPEERDRLAEKLAGQLTPTDLVIRDSKVEAPDGSVGWLRLRWSGSELGPKVITATLWMGQKGTVTERLEVRALFVGPLATRASQVDPFGDNLTPDELPKTYYLECWSPTRSSFRLKVRAAHSRLDPQKNPFEVGEPVPLTEAELKAVNRGEGALPTPVLSGYRVPLTLRRQSADGSAAFELGRFKQYVELSTDDDPTPLVVRVVGVLVGDLRTRGPEAGVILFGPFPRTRGKEKTVAVEADASATKLTVDGRTADFLAVEVPDEPEKTGSRKTWLVKVRVKGDLVSGDFPNESDEQLRDSAVYLKAEYPAADENRPSVLRIPVYGNATEPQLDPGP